MAKMLSAPAFVDIEHPAVMRAIILHILEHGHIEGHDPRGRPIMTFSFPVEPWMAAKLAAFGAGDEDREPDDDIDEVPPTDRVACRGGRQQKAPRRGGA